MRSYKYPLGFAATALSVSLLSSPVIANENKAKEEVLVTGKYLYNDQMNALKTPTPIIDVPQSLSIVTAEQIKIQGFTSVGDIIDYTPGVNMSQGEGHRDAVVIRGIRSTADFYIDGVRDDVQYYRPLYNLEQVEILRGPNALLFGRGGTGGIVNRVTKKGMIGEDFNEYKVSLDSFGEHSVAIDTNKEINDKTAFRINVAYEGLENHRDFYDGDRFSVNPTLRFKMSDATTLDVSYEYLDHERFIDRGIPTGADGEPVEALDGIVFGDPDLNTSILEAHLWRATVQHAFSDTMKGNVSLFFGDYDKFYSNFYATDYDAAANTVELDGYADTTERKNLILSGNLVNQFTTGNIGHTLLAGIEYIDTSSDQDRFNAQWNTSGTDKEVFDISDPLRLRGGFGINAAGDPTFNNFATDLADDTRVEIEVTSLFVQDEIALSENLDIILGARFDQFDISVFNADPAAAAEDVRRSREDEEVSPRAGIVYKPQENISIYASYSESFLPRSGEQFANLGGGADDLDPDVFENTEFGVKWDFANGLSLTAAYFENEETTAGTDGVTSDVFDVRGVEVDGYELQLEGQVTKNTTIRAGFSKLDGDTRNGSGDIVDAKEIPETMASIWGTYQHSDQLGFGLGATYQDESLISDGGSAVLPSYTRVDGVVYYDLSNNTRVQLNIENLLDEEYYPTAHATYQASVGAPRSARISISGRF